uniref:Putative secreted protein n=1 Tax=Anopheles darlingi TaxID=43151 RepID=A0A2M4D4U3_ANODA
MAAAAAYVCGCVRLGCCCWNSTMAAPAAVKMKTVQLQPPFPHPLKPINHDLFLPAPLSPLKHAKSR